MYNLKTLFPQKKMMHIKPRHYRRQCWVAHGNIRAFAKLRLCNVCVLSRVTPQPPRRKSSYFRRIIGLWIWPKSGHRVVLSLSFIVRDAVALREINKRRLRTRATRRRYVVVAHCVEQSYLLRRIITWNQREKGLWRVFFCFWTAVLVSCNANGSVWLASLPPNQTRSAQSVKQGIRSVVNFL